MTAVDIARFVLPGCLLLLGAACARGIQTETPEVAGPRAPAPVSRTFGDLTIHVLHTGWVSVKEAHRTLRAPAPLRLPAIVLGQKWTEWMPVYSFAIRHPEGTWLVDAGLTEDSVRLGERSCDGANKFVYKNLLRFRHQPEQRVDRQLQKLNIPLDSIRGVVFTHRHADHTDAFPFLPATASAWVGNGDWPSHTGALNCLWPSERIPKLVDDDGEPFAALPHSRALTADGRLRVVPLRGHSPGHLGVMAELDNRKYALFAGDAAFSLEQVETQTIAGISEVPKLARNSLALIRTQLERYPTFLLPAHDLASVFRFEGDILSQVRTPSK